MYRYSTLLLFIWLSACTVGPDYQAPEQPLSGRFFEGGSQAIGDATMQSWWLTFDDPMLNDLVQAGLKQNLSVQAALARVTESQAAARATGLPALISGPVTAESTRSGGDQIAGTTSTNSGAFSPSLILDLFGRERRAREAALAALQSAELSVGEARLAFLATLVNNYIDLRYYQNALEITRRTVGTRRETLKLVISQRDAGAASALDEAQAQAALDESLALLPVQESGYYGSAYAIAALLAEADNGLVRRLQRGAAQPWARGDAKAGVPADLLRNRPDIRRAERDYASAVAAIGVNEAQMYPAVTLGGTVSASEGVESWSFGPKLNLPVLSQGVLRANRDQAIARAAQAELLWRNSVLRAVKEIQTAQTQYIRAARSVTAQRRSVASFGRVATLSLENYRGGSTSLLDYLDAQRLLANSELNLASSVRDAANSWARLQVAAGKGWMSNSQSIPE